MSHCRPITILGQIYRLMTKIAADQILAVWALWLPPTISGGIPGRGSRMLMLAHQCRLEPSILQNSQLDGFVPDLIKAFNCIPRRPLVHMLSNAGVPNLGCRPLQTSVQVTPTWPIFGRPRVLNHRGPGRRFHVSLWNN